jgi:hypothetical protein
VRPAENPAWKLSPTPSVPPSPGEPVAVLASLDRRRDHPLRSIGANHDVGASGLVGFSPTAGRVLVVIVYRDLDGDLHGMNAWPATGRDLTTYLKEGHDGEQA